MNEDIQHFIVQSIIDLNARLDYLEKSSVYTVQKDIQMFDGRNFILATGTGTKIGTATGQKLSVFGAAPVVQAGAITAPTGGTTVDTQARTAISSIITAIKNFGVSA